MKKIQFTLQNKLLQVTPGTTILEAARSEGLFIPTFCHSELLKPKSACYACVVEVAGKHDLLPACSTPVEEGMVIKTESKRVLDARRVCVELLLSNHFGDCLGPCMTSCPAGIDIPGFIAHLAKGEDREALQLIKQDMPLPGVLGRICHRPCENDCRRYLVDEPIDICSLKRFADDTLAESGEKYLPPKAQASGKKVAVVGAGPAGLSAAYYLQLMGHSCTVLDANDHAGGMLRYGVPLFKLTHDVLDREISVIEDLGAEFKYGVSMGTDISLNTLRNQYDAVFLAIGAQLGQTPGLEGENVKGVSIGLDFLRACNMQPEKAPSTGKRVVVVGGGGVAFDVARTALRKGAEDVQIFCLEQRADMPAIEKEIAAGLEEGIILETGWAIKRLVTKSQKLNGVEFISCITVFDENGAFAPICDETKTKTVACDNIIFAVGQGVDTKTVEGIQTTARGGIAAAPKTLGTSFPDVFAGGDCVTGPGTAVEAVKAGKRAAASINQFLTGPEVMREIEIYSHKMGTLDSIPGEVVSAYKKSHQKASRVPVPKQAVNKRVQSFSEVESGDTAKMAQEEAKRCMECGCRDAHECKLRTYATMTGAEQSHFQDETPKKYSVDRTHENIQYETNKCILCRKCVRISEEVLDTSAMTIIERGTETRVIPSSKAGLGGVEGRGLEIIVEHCPVGALTLKSDPVQTRQILLNRPRNK